MSRQARLASLVFTISSLVGGAARAQVAPATAIAPEPAPAADPALAPAPAPQLPPPAAPSVAAPTPPGAARAEVRSREELAEFTAFLERNDDPTRTYRLVGGLVGIGVGGLVIPLGASMYDREPGVGAGVTLGVGIGAAVGGTLVLLGSTKRPYRDAADAVAQVRGLGRGDAAALAAGEDALRKAAADERTERLVGGGVFLGLSVIALGFGTTFAAADFTSASFDRDEQDGVAAAFLVGGALGTVGAVDMLFSPMPDEMAWEGYAAGRKVGTAPAPRVTGLGVSPLPEGGARVGLGGRF